MNKINIVVSIVLILLVPLVLGHHRLKLINDRWDYFTQVDNDSELQQKVIATIVLETGHTKGDKSIAVLESMVNRAYMHSYSSLSQAIEDGFYGPWNRGQVQQLIKKGLSDKDIEIGKYAIFHVRYGSNIIGGRTDQGGFHEFTFRDNMISIDGEWFGYQSKEQMEQIQGQQ